MSTRKALILGVTGMDGSILSEILLDKGYEVHGMMRRVSVFNTERIDHLLDKHPGFIVHHGDATDPTSLGRIFSIVKPDEVYALQAQSHVKVSFDQPAFTSDTIYYGVLYVLELMRNYFSNIKMYYAGSSEQFGSSPSPQNEETPFRPVSPYAVAKTAGYHLCSMYRKAYNLFICCGILFNHESSRRGETFVTRKISRAVARIYYGKQDKLKLGNLEAKRDWGYAPDFCEAMYLMLQHNIPDDYVVATGESHTVTEFVELAFNVVGLDWKKYVEIDSSYFRPNEVDELRGDYSKVKRVLGWQPTVSFNELINIMVKADLDRETKVR